MHKLLSIQKKEIATYGDFIQNSKSIIHNYNQAPLHAEVIFDNIIRKSRAGMLGRNPSECRSHFRLIDVGKIHCKVTS